MRIISRFFGFLSLIFITVGLLYSPLLNADVIQITDQDNNISISEDSLYLVDDTSSLEIDDILKDEQQSKFVQTQSSVPGFGLTDSSIWFKVTYVDLRTLSAEKKLLLEFGYPLIDRIEIYRKTKAGYERHVTGSLSAYETREVKHRNYLFYLPSAKDAPVTVYLKIKTLTPLIVPLKIKTLQYVHEIDKKEDFLLMSVLSCFATLFLYNLSLCFTLREKSHYFYLGFLVTLFLPLSYLMGVVPLIIDSSPRWIATEFWGYLAVLEIFFILFVSEVLDINRRDSLMGRIGWVLVAIYLFEACIVFLSDVRFWGVGVCLLIPLCSFILVNFAYGTYQKNRAAIVGLVAWTPTLTAAVIWILGGLGYIAMTWWVMYGVYFGVAFSAILLAFSVGDKINTAKKETYLLEQRTRKALELKNQDLQKSNQVKESFLSTVSHELRTPLNGVLGSLSLLEINVKAMSKLDQLALKSVLLGDLNRANQSSEEMLTLVNEIIDFSELDAGKTELNNNYFSPRALIIEIVEPFMDEIKAKGVRLNLDLDALILTEVYSDRQLYRKLFSALIKNAVKFTARGEISIVGASEITEEGASTLIFAIKDSGVGIPKSKMREIMQPFSQADQSITRRFGGLGIGLPVCKEVVTILGGKINFNSSEEIGTTVSLEFTGLPMRIVQAPDNLEVATQAESQAPSQKAANDSVEEYVLIVEDNKTNQLVAKSIVKKMGLIPLLAENGSVGIEMIKTHKVDYVLMDCQMPVMDGYEATRQIRKMQSPQAALPIIALTANTADSDRRRCVEAGMDDFIPKPITYKILEVKINEWRNKQSKISGQSIG
ncbi:MAG: hypothetical protein COB51_13735 [Moraxellaceae bacterium]|nr:MAG: hypothetical protein COB51_13735 [Moraxellaceae bacterium]